MTVETLRFVVVVGATAVGKTAALDAAAARWRRRHAGRNLEIVSADSIQVYRELTIGAAKPSPEQLLSLPHHLINIRSLGVSDSDPGGDRTAGADGAAYSVADFVRDARRAVAEICRRGNVPVVTAGTAFYLKHLLFGLPTTPASEPVLRARLEDDCARQGSQRLWARLRDVDPVGAARIASTDGYRVVRALEVYELTGTPISSFALPNAVLPQYQVLMVGLERPRAELYKRIDNRVLAMIEQGLPAECHDLAARGLATAVRRIGAIGYREFIDNAVAEDSVTAAETIAQIQQNSRRYAKRQLTFFRALPNITWLPADDIDQLYSRMNAWWSTG